MSWSRSLVATHTDAVDCITVANAKVYSASFGCIKISGLFDEISTQSNEIGFLSEINVFDDYFCTSTYNGITLYKVICKYFPI